MSNTRLRRFSKKLLSWATIMVLLLVSTTALGAGRVVWKTKTLKERTSSKSWRVELTIYLNGKPDTAYVPMKFEFQPIAYYERAMVDGDKLTERTVPLEHNQSLIETVDVGFLDPGTATIQNRTKFSFKVTRAHDYAAGEYKVTITDARTGKKIGQPQKIIFQGENEIIDRRSITFSGKKKEKKKDEEEKEGAESSGETEDEPTEKMDLQDEELEDEDYDEDYDEGEVKEKPGGCGCRVGPSPAQSGAWLSLALGLVVFGARRRRS